MDFEDNDEDILSNIIMINKELLPDGDYGSIGEDVEVRKESAEDSVEPVPVGSDGATDEHILSNSNKENNGHSKVADGSIQREPSATIVATSSRPKHPRVPNTQSRNPLRPHLPRKSKSYAKVMLKNIAKGIIISKIGSSSKKNARKRYVRGNKPIDSFRAITKKSCSRCGRCCCYRSSGY